MVNKTLFMTLLIVIGCKYLWAGQRIIIEKDHVIFSLFLLSSSDLGKNDTLILEYSIQNNSNKPIAVLDLDIPGKDKVRPISVNDKFEIFIELGGISIYSENRYPKFRLINKNNKYSIIFSMPISRLINKIIQDRTKRNIPVVKFLKDIEIIASISYSDDEKIINGDFSEVLYFDDYYGFLDQSISLPSLVECFSIFELKGLTIDLHIN